MESLTIMPDSRTVMPDKFYKGLEPAIRFLVRVIHEFGITTIQSCGGHLKKFPYVILVFYPDSIVYSNSLKKLQKLIRLVGKWNNEQEDKKWILVPGKWKHYEPHGYWINLDIFWLRPCEKNSPKEIMQLINLRAEIEDLARFFRKNQDSQ